MPSKQMTSQEYIKELRKKKLMLSKEEISFVVDFMMQLVKNSAIKDAHAVSLCTQLLPEMYERSNKTLDEILKNVHEAEILYVNFNLRF
jgi:hypothetical protein